MSSHAATIHWQLKAGDDFLKGKYSREHTWTFDGGFTMPASPAPAVVPVPFSNEAYVDPEEAFIASVASCHMLFFLYFAAQKGFQVTSYEDTAEGVVTKNAQGKGWVSSISLKPKVVYGGDKQPSMEDEDKLHHFAHEHCFIANSIKTEIQLLPVR